jgi:hypothetical protein
MSLSDEERARIRQEERARMDARAEARREQYPRLIAVVVAWGVALATVALLMGR